METTYGYDSKTDTILVRRTEDKNIANGAAYLEQKVEELAALKAAMVEKIAPMTEQYNALAAEIGKIRAAMKASVGPL